MDTRRNLLKKKQRVVIKIGSSSLQHTETGDMDYIRLEVLVRELCNLKNQGKDVVLVSSGAIAQGKKGASDAGAAAGASDRSQAGMCGGRSGTPDDDLSENFCRI